MKTSILIDDALIEEAMRTAGVKTKREAVELGLKALVRLGRQAEAQKLRGKLVWVGDLEAMRNEKWFLPSRASNISG